jgi:hypothetical protein
MPLLGGKGLSFQQLPVVVPVIPKSVIHIIKAKMPQFPDHRRKADFTCFKGF